MLKNVKNYALACLILVFCASCSVVDQAKFENLDRSVKSIQGATMTGVNYARFGELLQNLATEILIAKDQIKNPKQKELIDKYIAVFEIYKDSYEIWGFQLKSPPDEKTTVRVIANKYDFVVNPDAIDHSRMVQELWRVASEVSETIHGGRDAQRRAEEAAAHRKLAAAAAQRQAEEAAAQRKLAAAATRQRAEEEAAAAQQRVEEVIARQSQNMARLPGGCFQMGSPESEPNRGSNERQHRVCVEAFEIGKYEVTQEEWQAVMGSNPSSFKHGDRHPVEHVSWNDVQDYLQRLNQRTGKSYRLPTEAEWEYAALAGTTTPFWTGRCVTTQQANYDGDYGYGDPDCGAKTGNYRRKTMPVGSFPANPWGLYDTMGNVWEWTCSLYDRDYSGVETQCIEKYTKNPIVVRGGSWRDGPAWVRSASRYGFVDPTNRDRSRGFRIVRSL